MSASTWNILNEFQICSFVTNATGDRVIKEDILIVKPHQHPIKAGETTPGIEACDRCYFKRAK